MNEDINNAENIHHQIIADQDWQKYEAINNFRHFQNIHFYNNVFNINAENQMRKEQKMYQ